MEITEVENVRGRVETMTMFKTHAPEKFNNATLLGVFEAGSDEWHNARKDSIGGLGDVAQKWGQKFAEAKDASDISKAEMVLQSSWEKQQN